MAGPADRPKRPTIKDVAQHAGVSTSTVSYVLNDSGPVAADRRSRVLDAVRVLEYSPNESARNLKRNTTQTIAMIVPELSNPFFATVTEGVQRAAAARDVLVVVALPDDSAHSDEKSVGLLLRQRIDGVIYMSGTDSNPRSVYDLSRSGPVVLVDQRLPGLDLPAVVCDSRRCAREVATHILDHGHRHIGVIGGPEGLWTSEQRLAGYREAFAGAGLDPDTVPVVRGDYRRSAGYELARELLATSPRPTALICANDLMAMGAMHYLRDVGLSVPDDVSIVGFDDMQFSELLTPALTSVRQPAFDMGFRAAETLFAILDGADTVPTGDLVATVMFRDTVSAPAGPS